tara:strand:+ start:1934 stop:2302 length:369 start_codon:yes stop_codon:yes gene_type:complete
MSTIKVNTLEEATTGGATFYTAKAWVNFNGTGTVAIRADGNVSSITDNSTGVYTTNFTTNMSDANYATAASGGSTSSYDVSSTRIGDTLRNTYTTSAVTVITPNNNDTAEVDRERVLIQVTR